MPIATAALVVSALVFAPAASYLATRRGRSAMVWFALGGVIGFVAIILLLLAPPGRCPDCDARVRGWPRACDACGAPLLGAIAWDRSTTPSPEPPAEPRVVVRTVGTAAASGSAGVSPRPALALVPPPEDRTIVAPAGAQDGERGWDVARTAAASATSLSQAAARRRDRVGRDRLAPEASVLGSAIFLGGSGPVATNLSRLQVGDRYGLARVADELQILGPVSFDPERIVARVPIDGAEVELVADRLVVQGGPTARGTMLAFSGLAVFRGADVVAILKASSEQAG